MAFAENTSVAVEKSIGEIRGLLRKAGAGQLGHFEDDDRIAIQCSINDRLLRFAVSLPSLDSMPTRNGRGSTLTTAQRRDKADQAARQRARALLLVIKAKLESVESGVESFEEAFLANVVMPDGQTVAQHTLPRIADAYLGRPETALLTGY